MLPGCPCISLLLVLPLCRPFHLCRHCVGPWFKLLFASPYSKMLGRYGAAIQHKQIKLCVLLLSCWRCCVACPFGGHTHQIFPLLPLHFPCSCVALVSPCFIALLLFKFPFCRHCFHAINTIIVFKFVATKNKAGRRTRGTAMGGLYDASTPLALLHLLPIFH